MNQLNNELSKTLGYDKAVADMPPVRIVPRRKKKAASSIPAVPLTRNMQQSSTDVGYHGESPIYEAKSKPRARLNYELMEMKIMKAMQGENIKKEKVFKGQPVSEHHRF